VLTTRSIKTGFRCNQASHWLTSYDVGVDDFIYIRGGNASIPDGVRVNYDVGSMLTLVEAAGFIRPYLVFQPALCQLLLKNPLQLAFAAGIAATPWMPLWPLIDADKDMLLKLRHTDNVADFEGGVKATSPVLGLGFRPLADCGLALCGPG
jgi:hypothetical protein